MIPILAGIGIAYLGVAAYAWWFVISTPKIGTRGRTRTFGETMEVARREGPTLAVMALAWFPIAIVMVINALHRPSE